MKLPGHWQRCVTTVLQPPVCSQHCPYRTTEYPLGTAYPNEASAQWLLDQHSETDMVAWHCNTLQVCFGSYYCDIIGVSKIQGSNTVVPFYQWLWPLSLCWLWGSMLLLFIWYWLRIKQLIWHYTMPTPPQYHGYLQAVAQLLAWRSRAGLKKPLRVPFLLFKLSAHWLPNDLFKLVWEGAYRGFAMSAL